MAALYFGEGVVRETGDSAGAGSDGERVAEANQLLTVSGVAATRVSPGRRSLSTDIFMAT